MNTKQSTKPGMWDLDAVHCEGCLELKYKSDFRKSRNAVAGRSRKCKACERFGKAKKQKRTVL